jgi:hypothetical protein
MNSASPKSSLVKLGLQKQKPFRVMVLGQGGVGKTGRDFLEFLCSNFQKTSNTKFWWCDVYISNFQKIPVN